MRLKAKKKEKRLEHISHNKKLFGLILTIPLSQIYSQQKKMISKLQNLKIKTRKCLNQNKIDLRTFCEKKKKKKKKLPFLYTISSEF